MMKIKTTFAFLFSFVILFLIIILIASLALLQNRREFGKSQFDQHHSIKLSDQLRERNDDLTHYCLNYIITGDSIYEKAYWDLIHTTNKSLPLKAEGIILLEDSLRKMGYGERVFMLLKNALSLSEELKKREIHAFYTAKGWQTDSLGKYTIESTPDRNKALNIISHEGYLKDKRKIVRLITLFEQRIEQKTQAIWEQNVVEGLRLFYTVLLLIIFVLVFSCIAFYMIYKRVKKQEVQDARFRQGVVELQKTQRNLLKSEERFTLAVKGAEAIIWDYDVQNQSMLWSPNNCQLLDYPYREIEPTMAFLTAHLHRDEKERFRQHLQNHIEKGGPFNIDARFYNKQKELRWYRCKGSSSRDESNQSMRIVGVFTDITEHIRQEEKMMTAILETEDRERSRIARDIHDSLQQTMSTALLNFEKVRSSLEFTDQNNHERYQTGYQFLKKAIAESRTLAHNLMPKVVDQKGVAIAIENLIHALKDTTSTELVFYHNLGEERLKLAAELTIYRIVQEAITNMIKYSKAGNCTIQLLKYPNLIMLTIEDDGVGFELNQTNNTFGLNSMKTRAEAIGAYLQVETTPGNGTQILFELAH
ncbi:MAG: PAS domain-containing protein [Marinilabiliaceae bacterium]|nr:PAS domain-containing protein [Marinilabiliaceae bacterium]